MDNLPQLNFTYINNLPELIVKDLNANLVNIFLYSIGMVVYAIIVYKFYKNLAKRDIFSVDIEKPKAGSFLSKIWEFLLFLARSLIFFPIVTSLWFLLLSGILLFLSKSHNVEQILLMAMTIIAAARTTAYYNEELSVDVAKLVPLTLLGIFIVDTTYFSMESTIQKFYSVPSSFHIILQYLLYIVFLEFTLYSLHKIIRTFFLPETKHSSRNS